MKRSRIFLGLGSAVLAIVGIAATKGKHFKAVTVYYYTATTTPQTCPISVKYFCTEPGSGCSISVPGKGTFPAYRSVITSGETTKICSTTLESAGL